MDYALLFGLALFSYLLGSVNGSIIVSTVFHHVDIRNYGSGNAGSTNAYRVMGKKWAVLVIVIDILKAVFAVLTASILFAARPELNLARLIAGLLVIIGHIFPVFFRFRGGKGVMTLGATLAMVDWRVFLIVFSIFVLCFIISRWVSLASMVGSLTIPICMYFIHQGKGQETMAFVGLSALISAIVIFMHRDNIRRIARGEEKHFSFKGRAVLDNIKEKTALIKEKTTTSFQKTSAKMKKTTTEMLTKRTKRRRREKQRRRQRHNRRRKA